MNAKWLDPQCHEGCQSLLLKREIARLRAALTRIMNDQSGLDVTGLARIARESLEDAP